MYKIIFVFLAIMGIATASCAQQKQGANRKQPNNKVLIAYFSATGTTAGAAENCLRLQVENFMKLLQPNPIQMLTSIGITNNRAVRWK